MFEIGNSLREARVRRGIDFAQAELGTKIRGKYLRALEDEQFDVLPAQTYVKGFLRTYAEYLGLDGQLYVDEFNSRFVTGEDADFRTARRSTAARARGRRNRRFETNLVLLALGAVVVLAAVVLVSAWTTNGRTPKRSSSTPPKTVARRHVASRAAAPLLTVVGLHGATKVTARRGSASGAVAFDGTITAGHPESIRGSRLWVEIDTPSNLRILVRGREVHVPGNAPQVILVTASGWRPA